jgi:hypothetical protein
MKTKLEILELYRGMVDNLNKLYVIAKNPPDDMTIPELEELCENLDRQHQMNTLVEFILGVEKCWTTDEVSKLIRSEPPFVSDDFQIGPDGAYEHVDNSEDR